MNAFMNAKKGVVPGTFVPDTTPWVKRLGSARDGRREDADHADARARALLVRDRGEADDAGLRGMELRADDTLLVRLLREELDRALELDADPSGRLPVLRDAERQQRGAPDEDRPRRDGDRGAELHRRLEHAPDGRSRRGGVVRRVRLRLDRNGSRRGREVAGGRGGRGDTDRGGPRHR